MRGLLLSDDDCQLIDEALDLEILRQMAAASGDPAFCHGTPTSYHEERLRRALDLQQRVRRSSP